MNDATLQRSGPRPVLRFERHLADAPPVVWRALTEPDELMRWFPHDITTDEWKVGATLTFTDREGRGPAMTGVVLELDEPRVLAYMWGEETLRFELTPEPGGGTLLVLTDELDRNVAARNAAGWEQCLDLLAGGAEASGAWKQLFDRYAKEFEPELGPQDGPPPGYEP